MYVDLIGPVCRTCWCSVVNLFQNVMSLVYYNMFNIIPYSLHPNSPIVLRICILDTIEMLRVHVHCT